MYSKQEIVLHSQETITTVERKFYIDDLLKHKIVFKLSEGGFKLTKRILNNGEVSNAFPESDRGRLV